MASEKVAVEVKLEHVTTRDLLAEYAALLNHHGPDSEQAALFLEDHKNDQEFVRLARQ